MIFNNVDEIIRYLEREELYINGNSAILGDWFKGVNEKVVVEDRKEALNQILRDIRTNRLEGIEGPLPS